MESRRCVQWTHLSARLLGLQMTMLIAAAASSITRTLTACMSKVVVTPRIVLSACHVLPVAHPRGHGCAKNWRQQHVVVSCEQTAVHSSQSFPECCKYQRLPYRLECDERASPRSSNKGNYACFPRPQFVPHRGQQLANIKLHAAHPCLLHSRRPHAHHLMIASTASPKSIIWSSNSHFISSTQSQCSVACIGTGLEPHSHLGFHLNPQMPPVLHRFSPPFF